MRIGRIREPRAKLEKKLAESLEQQFATSDVLLGTPILSGLQYARV
jgi:hypothetical protein